MQSAEQATREVATSVSALVDGTAATTTTTDASSSSGTTTSNPLEALGLSKGLLEGLLDMPREFVPASLSAAQVQGLPMKEYLETTLLPVLLEGLKAVVRERPRNPSEYLAIYLLKNGPKSA